MGTRCLQQLLQPVWRRKRIGVEQCHVFGMALGDGVVVCSSKSQVAVHALHCEVIHGGKVLKRAVGAGVVYEQYLVGLHGLRLQVLHALGEQGPPFQLTMMTVTVAARAFAWRWGGDGI